MLLLLRLESNMISWGDDTTSKYLTRRTLSFPTKSALAGLLCSALGDFNNPDIFKFNIYTISYDRCPSRSKDCLLNDFQSMGNGYYDKHFTVVDSKGRYKTNMKSINGNDELGGNIKTQGAITNRHYLMNMGFFVIIEVDDVLGAKFIAALEDPYGFIFYGRKNCAPSLPPLVGCFNSFDEAFGVVNSAVSSDKLEVLECSCNGVGVYDRLIFDDPVCFKNRKFKARPVLIFNDYVSFKSHILGEQNV